MTDPMIAGLAAIFGIFVGSALQFWTTRYFDDRRAKREMQQAAYQKYLEGIARLSFSHDEKGKLDALAVIAEARGRVAVCGSDEVIMRMNRVFGHGENLRSIEGMKDASAMIEAMRLDARGSKLDGMNAEYFLLVFGDGPVGKQR